MVSPAMWTRGSGRRLRGNKGAQALAPYLTSCLSANQLGLYPITRETMASELGWTLDDVEDALQALERAGYAKYDREGEVVWVLNLVQIETGQGEQLGDRRRKGIENALRELGSHPFVAEFKRRYARLLGYPIDTVSDGLGVRPADTLSIPYANRIDTVSDTVSIPLARGSGSGSDQNKTEQSSARAGAHARDNAPVGASPSPGSTSSGLEKKLRGREGRKLRARDREYATSKGLTPEQAQHVWVKVQRDGIAKELRMTRKGWSMRYRGFVDTERREALPKSPAPAPPRPREARIARDPAERPATMGELAEALGKLDGVRASATKPRPAMPVPALQSPPSPEEIEQRRQAALADARRMAEEEGAHG
jgi:hypothetical protein